MKTEKGKIKSPSEKKKTFQEATFQSLNKTYPKIIKPKDRQELPKKDTFMVYILTYDKKAIVVGHGKYNRAQIIFDDENRITNNHLKSMPVRLHRLFGKGNFEQFVIPCNDKEDAKNTEKDLHKIIGGNKKEIGVPPEIKDSFLKNVERDSPTELMLKIALLSSFDGFNDLKTFKRNNLISPQVWDEIITLFQLEKLTDKKNRKAFFIE